MQTPESLDPEIVLRSDFEREDREDSRSLRWSLFTALAAHALALTVALPAVEAAYELSTVACGFAPSKEIYARPAAPRAAPKVVPKPLERRLCQLFTESPLEGEGTPEPILELNLDDVLRPQSEPSQSSRELGITPRLTHCVEPPWTEIARKARIEGAIILEILIREDGTVKDAEVLKGLPFGLSDSAVEAVLSWRYAPVELEGKPVALRHLVALRHGLDEPICPRELATSTRHPHR